MEEWEDLFGDLKPGYDRLPNPRDVNRPDLPPDLAEFYRHHEGIGYDSREDRFHRFARLDEIRRITSWEDFGFGHEPPHPGWATISGWIIGFTSYGEDLVYVLDIPGVAPGSIMGMDVTTCDGPPGNDDQSPCGFLVLAASFGRWIERMEILGPKADGLGVYDEIEAEIAALNPYSFRAKCHNSDEK